MLYCTTTPDLYLLAAIFPDRSAFIPVTSLAGYKSLQWQGTLQQVCILCLEL